MRLFHFLNAEYGLQDIRGRRLKISRIAELNDPFEFLGVELSNRETRASLRKTKAELSERHGLLCFSESWHNPVLWSHYADNHRGICLGFDIPNQLPRKINYVDSRFDWPSDVDEDFVSRLLFSKFRHWSYEEEYRIYTTLEDSEDGIYYAHFGNTLLLRQAIVGAESTLARADISGALGDLSESVEVFKARAAFKTFRMVRNKNNALWA